MKHPSSKSSADKPRSRAGLFLLYAALSAASAVMLSLALPGYEHWYLLFIALVPVLVVLQRSSTRATIVVFWATGFLFFLVAVYWLCHLTAIAWLALAFYLSLSFPVFALVARLLSAERPRVPFVLAVPMAWVALEILRGLPLGGFCWHYLGHGLYRQTTWIQIADFSGVYGVSFVLITVNALLARLICLASGREPRRALRAAVGVLYVALLLLGVVAYGRFRIGETRPIPGPRISVVQGNIPQELKEFTRSYTWPQILERRDVIMSKYEGLTARLVGVQDDMVVWPETIVAYLQGERDANRDYSAEAEKRVRRLCRQLGRPFLTGSGKLVFDGASERSYNAACFFPSPAAPFEVYLKIHLVPFGEFIPFSSVAWIRDILHRFLPQGYEATLSAGADPLLFRLGGVPFATPICYEDTKPSLICTFTREGARFIVNLTNDGWFRDTAELDQHLANSVFRTVENRVALVRAANTGISAFITPAGVITSVVADSAGKRREVEGVLTDSVQLDARHAFYTAHGDLFVWTLVALTLLIGLPKAGLLRAARSRRNALDAKGL